MNHWQEWRKQQRVTLLAQRKNMSAVDHESKSAIITAFLKQGFPVLQHHRTGFYWPYQNEYDPRPVMQFLYQQGATLALPEIVRRHQPLQFRQWWPEAPMEAGLFNIPVPANTPVIAIDAVIIPMTGFDRLGYRLGYGGGYYDRTLALADPRPLTIGVAFETGRLDTIYPQSHDIPLDFIVTECGIHQPVDNRLHLLQEDVWPVRC